MSKYSCYIIDDEIKSAELLKLLVEEVDSDISIDGTFSNPLDALESLKGNIPDFIFLDIQMPHMNGIQFAEKIAHLDVLVIFVTSYADYALDAIKRSAVDYVMKPLEINDLKIAIRKVRDQVDRKQEEALNRLLLGNFIKKEISSKNIGIPSVDGLDFVAMVDILYCEGKERYTEVALRNGQIILSSYNLGKFTEILDTSVFLQVHRSFIINLSCISQYKKEGTIVLINGSTIPLARRRKDEFMNRITKVGN